MLFLQLLLVVSSACCGLVHALPSSWVRLLSINQSPAIKRQPLPSAERAVLRCGRSFNNTNCPPGSCCSGEGYCGTDRSYCSSPYCQINHSDSCDGQRRPVGPDTSNVPRPQVGKVPYGKGLYHCSRAGDIALTFDDGPGNYTKDLLDMLKKYDARATFFIAGNSLNKGMISDDSTAWPMIIRRMVNEGHQIASHTWGHYRMSELPTPLIKQGMIYNEIALNSILGYFPTYMRPPYSNCDNRCEKIMGELGYHITYFDLDTEGYLHNSKESIQLSRDIWNKKAGSADPNTTSFLHIEHDPIYWSVYGLTEHILKSIKAKGFKAVPVGTCMNDPPTNWYRRIGN